MEDFKKCLKDQMNSCRTFWRRSVDITCELNLVMFRLESQLIGSESWCNYIWRESRRSSELSGCCQRLKRKVWCWRLWSWCCRIVHKLARNTILEQEVVLVCWWAQVLPPAAVITEGQKDLNWLVVPSCRRCSLLYNRIIKELQRSIRCAPARWAVLQTHWLLFVWTPGHPSDGSCM